MYRTLGLMVIACMLGCDTGPQYFPVEGTVVLNNQPVADAAVLFQPDAAGPVASGVTDPQGKFFLKTNKQVGAVAGSYRVGISKQVTTGISTDDDTASGGLKITWIVPQSYSIPAKSGLVAEVSPDQLQFAFELRTR